MILFLLLLFIRFALLEKCSPFDDNNSSNNYRQSSYSLRDTASRKSHERQRRSAESVIDIASSSDDESLIEPTVSFRCISILPFN